MLQHPPLRLVQGLTLRFINLFNTGKTLLKRPSSAISSKFLYPRILLELERIYNPVGFLLEIAHFKYMPRPSRVPAVSDIDFMP